jgi:hypothetical protein
MAQTKKKDEKTAPKTPFFNRFLTTVQLKARSGIKAGAPAGARPV